MRSAQASCGSSAMIRVLLVEDDLDLTRALRESLELSPPPGVRLELSAAGTLRAAHDELRRASYDAVLLDLGLPDSQGLETLARLHDQWPRVPIVVLTGQSDETVAIDAAAQGAQDYLIKGSVDPATLVRSIRYAIERTRGEAALRRSEERLRLALAAANMGIWEWSLADDRLTISPELLDRVGVPGDAAPRTLEELLALVHDDDREAVARAAGALSPNGSQGGERFEATFRLGRRGRWVLSKGRLVEADPGLVIGTITDVTELKELEARLLHSQKLESIGRLAGGVAHDFNNLLTVILGSASLAETDPTITGTRALTHLRNIREASDRAAQLTSRLLTFARKQVVRLRAVDLSAVVRDLHDMLRRLLGEAVALELALADGLPTVRADPVQLEQVIVNLVVNARDAMPHGGRLTLETSRHVVAGGAGGAAEAEGLPPGEYVRLRVVDTGQGMSPSVLTHVFEPFFTTKEGTGTGLGLATCYGVVTQLGGQITVQSAPERGSTFTVHLPSAADRLDAPAPAPSSAPTGRETLLLVEDDPLVRQLATASLSMQGYLVLPAASAADALRLVRAGRTHVDLLVTDVVMPDGDGRELAREVRAHATVRVLFMSGYTGDALPPGEHFLQKPFTPSSLARAVRAALDGDAPS